MTDSAALHAAREAAEAEALTLGHDVPGISLIPLLHAADAVRGAILAILVKDRDRAAQCLRDAARAAADAFPPASRESYALAIVLGAVTEAAGGVS